MSGAFEPTEAESELEFDQQLFTLAGFALITLIVVVVFLLTGVMNLGQVRGAFETNINNSIAEIQALLPPTFRIAQSVLNTFINVATSVFNGLSYLVIHGTQAILNAILAIGGLIVDALQTSIKLVVDQLQALGSQVMMFFQSVFSPVVQFVTLAGQTVTLYCGLVFSIFSPILNFIGAIFRAIQRIGTIFT